MTLRSTLPLFLYQAAWRGFGSRAAGRRLVKSLDSRDETERTVAGIFLVRGRSAAVPLLREALDRRHALSMVIKLAANIRARELAPAIAQYTEDRNPELARTAREALLALEEAAGSGSE